MGCFGYGISSFDWNDYLSKKRRLRKLKHKATKKEAAMWKSASYDSGSSAYSGTTDANHQPKFCSKCGAAMNPTFRFCPGCGAPRKSVTRHKDACTCGTVLGSGDKFCPTCGLKHAA